MEEGIVVVSGSYIETEIVGGKSSIKVIPTRDYLPGTHSVTLQYLGDNQYPASKPQQVSFTLPKLTSSILSCSGRNIPVGRDETITCTVPEGASGICVCTVGISGSDPRVSEGTIDSGSAKVVFSSLPKGNYTAVCQYLGDDLFAESETKSCMFVVSKGGGGLV